MADTKARVARPLSPHIQIYRFMLTYVMSGFHRATGAALYFGIVFLVWWLMAAAAGPNAYEKVQWFFGTIIGRLVVVGLVWGLIHHSLGGIRHLIWDTIHGFGPNEREWLARATLAGSIGLTLIFCIVAYLVMGGAR
jgi:succinate dehydrogenase cytochrome b subunit